MLIFLSDFFKRPSSTTSELSCPFSMVALFKLYIICFQRKAKSNYTALIILCFQQTLSSNFEDDFPTSAGVNKGSVSPRASHSFPFLLFIIRGSIYCHCCKYELHRKRTLLTDCWISLPETALQGQHIESKTHHPSLVDFSKLSS